METLINNFVSEHLAVFVVACIVALAIFAMALWFVFSYIQFKKTAKCSEHSAKIEELGKVSYNLPCNTHAEKIETHSVAVGRLDASLKFLAKNLEDTNVKVQNLVTASAFTKQHSPLEITDKGWEAVRKLGMDKMFEGNWERIKKLIDDEVEDKNAYDINEFCIKYAVVYPERFLKDEEVLVLKNDAYVQGFTLMEYMKIIAVMARDRYFKERGVEVKKE